MNVGFIGLGSQGAPMAARIGEVFDLAVWARRPESITSFTGRVARVATSARDLATSCDVVCLCVRDDAGVRAVCDGPAGVLAGLAPRAVLVVHSTVHPNTVRQLAVDAHASGVEVLDAPVSGANAAAEGRLVTMAGGDQKVFDRVRPILATHSDRIFLVGPVGAGQIAKLVNNALFTAHLALAATALDAGEQLGLARDVLHQVLSAGSGRSAALELSRRLAVDGLVDRSAADLLTKDVRLFAGVAAEANVDAGPLVGPAQRLLDRQPQSTGPPTE
ncbi:MAG TPA: NAD(P)-dependent oxidoreductase [Acidimicrobiales bacterium]|jgi:3-hydroxyisobutyrate dehydrogenase-like beta-hydroxyacid dehydrogenase